MADTEKGMDVADMKRLLSKSKQEPVNVAVGLSGKGAVMMLHKTKQPKAVSKMLEEQHDDVKNLRWGTAFVDVDADAKLVILTLNRAAPGMGTKLKKTLKGTGFSKVRIQDESGAVLEDVAEEEEGQETDGQQAAPNGQADAAPTAERPQTPPDSGQPAPQAAPQSGEKFNPAALTKRLGELVKQMLPLMRSDPDRAAELKQLAAQAQTALRGGDEQAALQAVDAFERALTGGTQAGGGAQAGAAAAGAAAGAATEATGADGAAGAAGAAGGAAVQALQQSRVAWVSARQKIEDEIGKLHDAMAKHYDGHAFGTDLDKIFSSKIEPILSSLDHTLADKLDEVGKATDPAERSKLAGEAQKVIDRYEQFVGSDPTLAQIDKNPFVPTAIVDTVTSSLNAVKQSVQQVAQNISS